jgi:hypothetical protein
MVPALATPVISTDWAINLTSLTSMKTIATPPCHVNFITPPPLLRPPSHTVFSQCLHSLQPGPISQPTPAIHIPSVTLCTPSPLHSPNQPPPLPNTQASLPLLPYCFQYGYSLTNIDPMQVVMAPRHRPVPPEWAPSHQRN